MAPGIVGRACALPGPSYLIISYAIGMWLGNAVLILYVCGSGEALLEFSFSKLITGCEFACQEVNHNIASSSCPAL